MSHIVLLGDSVFDNRAYTQGEPDVAAHLRDVLPGWKVTLRAVDGSTTSDLGVQFSRVPRNASHLVLSIGGNDALLNSDLLATPVRSTSEALELFRERLDVFEIMHGYAVEALVALKRPATICTIYNGDLAAREATLARTALMMFNDIIIRNALKWSVNVIELRVVCSAPEDYANPIEPSGTGGRKIARAIAGALGAAAVPTQRSVIVGL